MNQQIIDTSQALIRVREERERQDEKWGPQNHENLYWLGILMEEVGEVSKLLIDPLPIHGEDDRTYAELEQEWGQREDDIEAEITQVAAVAVAWLESHRRRQREE